MTFYQVVAVKGKTTVVLKEVRKNLSYTGDMSGTATPIPGDFIEGTEITKRVRDNASKLAINISSYESAYKTTPDKAHSFTSYG